MRVCALPMKQLAAKFLLQKPDRACQGGLRNIALLGGSSEIELGGDREKIPDLMHFHCTLPIAGGVRRMGQTLSFGYSTGNDKKLHAPLKQFVSDPGPQRRASWPAERASHALTRPILAQPPWQECS